MANLFRSTVRNGRNLFRRKSFDGVEDERFAVLRAGVTQGELNQGDHFVGVSNLLWSPGPIVRTNALLSSGVIRLIKLQPRFALIGGRSFAAGVICICFSA